MLASAGPVWNGNEVWLLAGGGVLFFAFPAAYASGFQGFYLPLIIVLWLLILRGIAVPPSFATRSRVWCGIRCGTWCSPPQARCSRFSSSAPRLATLYAAFRLTTRASSAAARANLPLMPTAGILDWFTIIVALGSFAALTVHGALWVAMQTEGAVAARAHQAAEVAWWAVLVITALLVIIVPLVQPHLGHRFADAPWGFVFPLAAATGMFGMKLLYRRRAADGGVLLASCLYIVGMLTSAAFGLYPYLLPSSTRRPRGLRFPTAPPDPTALPWAFTGSSPAWRWSRSISCSCTA